MPYSARSTQLQSINSETFGTVIPRQKLSERIIRDQLMYDTRICCFVDILGFGSTVDESIDNSGTISTKYDAIVWLIDQFHQNARTHPDLSTTRKVTQFSDSLVISFDPTERSQVFYVLLDLLHLSLNLAANGYILRGGVTMGYLTHTNDKLFGPALNSAYMLESKCAKYPRIIIDSGVVDIATEFPLSINSADEELESIMKIVSRDDDGYLYIDYITKAHEEFDDQNYGLYDYIQSLKSIAQTTLQHESTSVQDKGKWIKSKINPFIKKIKRAAFTVDNYDGDYEINQLFRNLSEIA